MKVNVPFLLIKISGGIYSYSHPLLPSSCIDKPPLIVTHLLKTNDSQVILLKTYQPINSKFYQVLYVFNKR